MDRIFTSFEEALKTFNNKDYREELYDAKSLRILENNKVKIGNTEFVYDNIFLDSVFKITKLPIGNANVLPTENVIADLNVILENLGIDVSVRFVNGIAYSLFPASNSGAKLPLTHKDFLELFDSKLDCSNAIVSQSDKFLRLIVFYDDMEINFDNSSYRIGLDIINGETFKSPPTTINAVLRKNGTTETFVLPVLNKPIKINGSSNLNKLKECFDKKIDSIEIDKELFIKRFDRLNKYYINDEVIRVLFHGTRFLPIDARIGFFEPYFKINENGKITDVINKSSINKDEPVINIVNKLVKLIDDNRELMDVVNTYKADCFSGSLLSENNCKFNEALLANF